MYVRLSVAAKHFNVSKQTISKWANDGRIECMRLPSGRRRYSIRSDGGRSGEPNASDQEKVNVCYCRVSSHGQKDDLDRQVEYMRTKYPGWQIVTDVGSGLNWKRKGLRTLLRRCLQGSVAKVSVAHRDRLARFGFELLGYVLGECGVELLCDDQEAHTSKEFELAEDILAIVTVFGARDNGSRKYKAREKGDSRAGQGDGTHAAPVDGSVPVDL